MTNTTNANTTKQHGPNVKQLIAYRMAVAVVRTGGTLTDALRTSSDPKRLRRLNQAAADATEWVEEQIADVRATAGNHGDSDEEIAGEILRRMGR